MNIGEKIRTIRKELNITQKELVGEELTRNMLSRIENGFALPSVPTLIYIARRLGVPAGFLIADDDEDLLYRKQAEFSKIRQAFTRSEWKTCLGYCSLLGESDPEIDRYSTACHFNLAVECFNCGELGKAAEKFQSLRKKCADYKNSSYPDNKLNSILFAESSVYLNCISDISKTFCSEQIDRFVLAPSEFCTPFINYYYFYNPFLANRRSKIETDEYLSSSDHETEPYAGHIRARLLMKNSEYREARKIIQEIAYGEKVLPQPVLLFMLSDLEICCRELSDYKSAYECSGLHRQLLDSFLSDTYL